LIGADGWGFFQFHHRPLSPLCPLSPYLTKYFLYLYNAVVNTQYLYLYQTFTLMLIYKTSRPYTLLYVLKQWLIITLVFSVPVLFNYALNKDFIKSGYYVVFVATFLTGFSRDIYTRRLITLKMDIENGLIFFVYKTLMSRPATITLAIQDTRLEIVRRKIKPLKIKQPVTIYFLKEKAEIFEINVSKDGFSAEALAQVETALQNLHVPITKG